MKRILLQWVACPICLEELLVSDARVTTEEDEIIDGSLICRGCGAAYPISSGVPQLLPESLDATTQRTSASFGMLWSRTTDDTTREGEHVGKTLVALSLNLPTGLILDAGCGDGSDSVALAGRSGATIVGVDISGGGTQTAFARTRHLPNVHIVRADLCRLPFRAGQFAFVYSYGVVHHVARPEQAVAELARVSSTAAEGAMYLYEDFAERSAVLRYGLRAANAWRHITTKLPHRLLYALCTIASPLIYLSFTIPHKVLARLPGCGTIARGIPFHFGRGPFDLIGDLYDRFATPVEYRYSRDSAVRLAEEGGFVVRSIQQHHGWMLGLQRTSSGGLT